MSLDAELGIKKGVHVALLSDTHAGLRIVLFKKKLSMQAALEECSQRIALEDPYMMRMLDELADRKKQKLVKALSSTDAETLLDAINRTGALKDSGATSDG